jgi:hypothetical protein
MEEPTGREEFGGLLQRDEFIIIHPFSKVMVMLLLLLVPSPVSPVHIHIHSPSPVPSIFPFFLFSVWPPVPIFFFFFFFFIRLLFSLPFPSYFHPKFAFPKGQLQPTQFLPHFFALLIVVPSQLPTYFLRWP